MKRAFLGTAAVVVAFVWACGSDDSSTPASSSGVFGGASDSGSTEGVECTHPGAGRSLGGDRCECSTTRNVTGEWSGKRTCREGTTCPTKDQDEPFKITQTGTAIRGEGASATFTGTICGDFIVWNGGPKDGSYKECGQIRFTDDSHYFKDSCYVASGECRANFGQGCPSETAQCTGTGAKKPEAAPAIAKDVCN